MLHPIVIDPNPILRKRAEEVPVSEITTPDFQKLLDDMIETMYKARGIGLAAPQIGISRRILIAETATKDTKEGLKNPIAVVNPELMAKSWRKVLSEEGCLSVPGVWGVVKRYKSVTVRGYGRDGKRLTIKNSALLGIILQHEIDHLNGVLFIDKAEKVQPITERAPRI